MPSLLSRADRLDRTMALIARRGTSNRFHRMVTLAVGADIDRAAYLVVRRLSFEGAARICDLADMMGVEPSTASRHVDHLVRRGWLEKATDPSDRRAAIAHVTARGRAMVDALGAERRRILDQALAKWSDADVDRFVALFEQFAEDVTATLDDLDGAATP